MAEKLTVKVERGKYATIVKLGGYLNATTCHQISFLLKSLMATPLQRVALDLANLKSVDGKGLQIIAEFFHAVSRKGIRIFAFGLQDDVYDILTLVDLGCDVEIFKDKAVFKIDPAANG